MYSTAIDLGALALHHGTPYFLYDLDRIQAKARRAKRALPASMWLAYALKANPHPRIAAALLGIVDGIDVSSPPEIDVALGAGFDGAALCFSGPGKTAEGIRRAHAVSARITAEAVDQIERIMKVAPAARVVLRVNPSRPVHAYRVAMGGRASAFGIDEERIEAARDKAPPFIGLQVFQGSQISSVGGVMMSVAQTLDIAERLDGVQWVSFGGGFTADFDVDALGAKLGPALEKFEVATGQHLAAGFELGRYLVADAGLYVARVVSIKDSRGERFVILDGGMNHNLFGTGLMGGPPRPLMNVTNPEGAPMEVNVHGPLCTPLDRYGDDPVVLSEPRVGDLIVAANTGAYGLSASPHGFIGHAAPAEVFVEDGAASA